jgi:proliferating cell nuclear antigen
MFEAKLSEGAILKKIVESIKDIVTDVNIDISPSGKYPYSTIHQHLTLVKLMAKWIIKSDAHHLLNFF